MSNHIRIGFNDPTTVIEYGRLYDIDKLEQKLLREGVPAENVTVEDVPSEDGIAK
jgi:hypothetical protein